MDGDNEKDHDAVQAMLCMVTQEDVSMDGDNEKDHEALNLLGFFTVSCFSECLSMKVVENCLNAFECFVLRSSKEECLLVYGEIMSFCTLCSALLGQMTPHLDELCGVILNLISYDPNFYDSGDAQDKWTAFKQPSFCISLHEPDFPIAFHISVFFLSSVIWNVKGYNS